MGQSGLYACLSKRLWKNGFLPHGVADSCYQEAGGVGIVFRMAMWNEDAGHFGLARHAQGNGRALRRNGERP
jgi:hypothetical protein